MREQHATIWNVWKGPLAVFGYVGLLIYLDRFATSFLPHLHQLIIGWGTFGALLLMYRFRKSRSMPLRMLFIIVSAFLSFRYIYWRGTETLTYPGALDFVAMTILFLAEVYGIIIHFLGMMLNAWPLKQPAIDPPEDRSTWPTVDVLVPTYNESDEIIRVTVIAALQIDYPRDKLRVHICDDGGTFAKRKHPESGMAAWERHYRLRRMAEELGANYITRPLNLQAKAGNVNHALTHTDGELVLVLDCDHVPTRDILRRTIGYFVADPKLFLVQTPHFFINPTPVERNLAGVSNPPGENDMFYRVIHPGLDFWGASYFCGSAALLRRAHVMEIGGLSGKTITEDAETAFALHSRGYRSVYFERPMVCGLSPETYDDYVIQRQRWAQGMLQMFLLNNPLFTKGLTLVQRLCYFNSCFFWFFGVVRFVYFVAPATFLLFGLQIYNASYAQILGYVLPYVLSSWLVMDFFYARARQPFFSEVYESVQSLFLMPAVLSVFLNPTKPTFKVTPKGSTLERETLNPMSASFLVVILINMVALAMGAYKWVDTPLLRDVIAVTGGWTLYNLFLALVSLGAFWEGRQVRNHHRIDSDGEITVYIPRLRMTCLGRVRDVSLRGVGFELAGDIQLKPMERVELRATDGDGNQYHFEARLQRIFPRGDKLFCGSLYVHDDPCDPQAISYTFGDSDRWMSLWMRKQEMGGTFANLMHFVKLGARGLRGSFEILYGNIAAIVMPLYKRGRENFPRWRLADER
jgi:cellulose synthase (UDP-forming)